MQNQKQSSPSIHGKRGVALVPAMVVISGLAIFLMALMTSVMSGSRSVLRQGDDYRISSAVESVSTLVTEGLWSTYVQSEGGAAGDITSFRLFLGTVGIGDSYVADPSLSVPPPATAGTDVMGYLNLPTVGGQRLFNEVAIDAARIVRRDVEDSTQLFLTISASTRRGGAIVNPILNRAVQQVYTVEPEDFSGFEYALLANNINCIFCHAKIDSADRYWNTDLEAEGSFDRVKIGALESLLVRHDADGNASTVNDFDADSFLAGTLYIRGLAATEDGSPITDWSDQTLMAYAFNDDGLIVENAFGLDHGPFSPAGDPPGALENLYLDYATDYASMVDGALPDHFPAPFPDDGGIDPITGLPDPAAAGNRQVDDVEFDRIAAQADGSITAGIVNVTDPSVTIDSALDYANAVFNGNTPGLNTAGNAVSGNVVLTGMPDNPIWIDGTLVIDGDLVIQGYVKGEGTIYVRGNVYIPSDLMYADGQTYLDGDADGAPTGPRTFGIAQDGTSNALGLTAGGNIMISDYQRPASVQPDATWDPPALHEIISGNPDTGDVLVDQWSFVLSEMALFNRAEWARTQEFLPGPGEIDFIDPDPSTPANEAWTVTNPDFEAGYTPRYYGYGDDSIIPIYNKGDLHYDGTSGAWIGEDTPIGWDTDWLSYADPTDSSDPFLFDSSGDPIAVTSSLEHSGGWMDPAVYKASVEYFESVRPGDTPLRIDGLLYTNNAIFSIVNRDTPMRGMMLVNGSLVAADIGILVPGKHDPTGSYSNHSPVSDWATGLQLNYDQRVKRMLNVTNPFQVQLKRTLWNPTANVL